MIFITNDQNKILNLLYKFTCSVCPTTIPASAFSMAEPVAVITRRGAAFSMAEPVAVSTMIHFEVTFIYLILPKLLSTTQLLHVLKRYIYVLRVRIVLL